MRLRGCSIIDSATVHCRDWAISLSEDYDLILVGTGIASSVFLHGWEKTARANARALVLEKGPNHPHAQRLAEPDALEALARAAFTNRTRKPWRFSVGFGGSSNCWYACTPRLLPNDFQLATRYGVGTDWPVTYDELEPHYCDAEDLLQVAGSSEHTPFRRSRPYPQAPHAFSLPDQRLAAAYPEHFFVQPAARPTRAVGNRPRCCANAVCSLCPIDSKFTVSNGLAHVYADPRITLRTESAVQAIEWQGRVASGVRYLRAGREHTARAELVVLGANALFNPHILMRSGLEHRLLGRFCHEQISARVVVQLDGLPGLQGSTIITGHGYMWYDGPHRRDRAAVLIETSNEPKYLRLDAPRWRDVLVLKLIMEELPDESVRVEVDPDTPDKPQVTGWNGPSAYVRRARAAAEAELPRLLATLPVEAIHVQPAFNPTESHILGTTRMGRDPETSIVDAHGVHHRLRNLIVLGGSTFPTCSPANPSLTIAALALRTAAAFPT